MRIFLIGFTGCGKSTIGKMLSQKLNLPFIDLDNCIEAKTKKTINEIFNIYGEQYFREYETLCLQDILNNKNAVIATGGGTPCFHNNMHVIKKNGTSIYLKKSNAVLWKRLRKIKSKLPLIAALTDKELEIYIADTLQERKNYYRQADHIIDIENLSSEQILFHSMKFIQNISSKS